MTRRNVAIVAWVVVFIAQCAVYIIKFPRLVADISANPTVFLEAAGATGTAVFVSIVGITVWIFVLVIPLSGKPRQFWLRMGEAVLAALFSLGICIAVLMK